MKYPYCLPIIASDKQSVRDIIGRNKDKYRYFEVWVDYIKGVDSVFLKELEADLPGRLVIVFRRQELEPIRMSLEQRFLLLNSLEGTTVLVDLDVASQQPEIDYVHKMDKGFSTIVSYHNYLETPENDRLHGILQQIRNKNPSIIKIATKCQNEKDCVRLLDLLVLLKEAGQKFIILGMGRHGLPTRIFGTLWGNQLAFAPEIASGQSAPGQLTRKQLDIILQIIGE